MTESKATAALLRQIRERYAGKPIFVRKIAQLVGAGLPDVHLIVRGVPMAIECKGPATPITELQAKTLRDIDAAGGRAYVLRFTGEGPATAHMLSRITRAGEIPLGQTLFTRIDQILERDPSQ
jgi:hypothetical protein